jgi:GTP-binding protein HflX
MRTSAAKERRDPDARLQEAIGLALALDLDVVGGELADLRQTVPATLFGKGKVEELADRCEAEAIEVLVIDDQLTPVQQRNLEKAIEVKVIDRTGLILEIFGRRARTREGRLQVELARLDYERSRLVRTWTHLERQSGGFGRTGGPGESQIELDRRLIADRIVKLKKDLAEVRRTRTLHRDSRQKAPFPTVVLVGYTNAGKSTLFNHLTDATVQAEDMLFATLDPTLRKIALPDGRPAMLSDTVGFISDLPHELVEAFRATLEEVLEADIILHVRDIASPDTAAQAKDVYQVLKGLGIDQDLDTRLIEVWNKVDLIEDDLARADLNGRARLSGNLVVSAVAGSGLEGLRDRLARDLSDGTPIHLTLRAEQGDVLAWLYRHGRVSHREDLDDGLMQLDVRLDEQAIGQFENLFPHISLKAEPPLREERPVPAAWTP